MSTAKEDVEALLSKLPDDCSIEDIQYHLYVLDKVRRGLEDARVNGALSQEEVEDRMMLLGRGTKQKVQYLLAHKINPGVAAHAGFVAARSRASLRFGRPGRGATARSARRRRGRTGPSRHSLTRVSTGRASGKRCRVTRRR